MTLRPSDFQWVEVEKLAEPSNYATVTVFRDCWWAVNAAGQVAFYKGKHPQCNGNRAIAERVGSQCVPGYAGVVQIPWAFLLHRCEDY